MPSSTIFNHHYQTSFIALLTLVSIDTFAAHSLPDISIYPDKPTLNQTLADHQVLEESDIAIAHERSITDVIQGLPGVGVNNGGFGQQSALVMRGAGGQGLVSLDGIPLYSSFPGLLSLDTLPVEALQKVEITQGPDSAFHSFQTIGGSIRLYSKDNLKSAAKLSAEGGSFGILRETLHGSLAGNLGRATMTLSRGDAFDGTHLADSTYNPERDPFRFTQGLLHFSTELSNRVQWQGSLLYRKSWVGNDKLGVDKNHRLAFVDDPLGYSNSETWLTQNTWNIKVNENWHSAWQLGYTQLNNGDRAGSIQNTINNRLFLVNVHNQHTLSENLPQHTQWIVHWGAQGRHEQGLAKTSPFNFAEQRNMASGFLNTEARYHDLSAEAGIRLEHYDHFGSHLLFKTAAAWKITPQLTVRASGGTGYRIPSYTELLTLFFGNRALVPEHSASGEIGIEWLPFNQVHLNLKGFHNHYTHLITQAYDAQRALLTMNVPNANISGVEFSGQYAWTDSLDTGVSYTYADSIDTDTNRPLPMRPPHTARIWGQQKLTSLPLILWAEATARSGTAYDPANSFAVKQSVQLNAAIRYPINTKFEVYLRGENLSNNRAQQIYSVDKPGIAVYGGFEIKL